MNTEPTQASRLKKKPSVADPLRLVQDAIDTDSDLHKEWMAEAGRGLVRAALLVGVVLWAASADAAPQREREIVSAWAAALVDATSDRWRAGRAVCPLDPITFTEIIGHPSGLKWCMTMEDADSFLAARGIAFKCSDALAYWRGEPSPWDEAVAQPAPATSRRDGWTLHKPQRFQGYVVPLYHLLRASHTDGKARPSARDVLEAWRVSQPAEVAMMLPESFDYYDRQGDTKPVSLKALQKAIDRMTKPR